MSNSPFIVLVTRPQWRRDALGRIHCRIAMEQGVVTASGSSLALHAQPDTRMRLTLLRTGRGARCHWHLLNARPAAGHRGAAHD